MIDPSITGRTGFSWSFEEHEREMERAGRRGAEAEDASRRRSRRKAEVVRRRKRRVEKKRSQG